MVVREVPEAVGRVGRVGRVEVLRAVSLVVLAEGLNHPRT